MTKLSQKRVVFFYFSAIATQTNDISTKVRAFTMSVENGGAKTTTDWRGRASLPAKRGRTLVRAHNERLATHMYREWQRRISGGAALSRADSCPHLSLVQHENLLSVSDGRQAVRDDHGRPVSLEAVQSLLYTLLRATEAQANREGGMRRHRTGPFITSKTTLFASMPH